VYGIVAFKVVELNGLKATAGKEQLVPENPAAQLKTWTLRVKVKVGPVGVLS